MNYKEYVKGKAAKQKQKGRKEKTAHEKALEQKAKYDKSMEGIETKLIPHPTSPRAWIEVIVNEKRV